MHNSWFVLPSNAKVMVYGTIKLEVCVIVGNNIQPLEQEVCFIFVKQLASVSEFTSQNCISALTLQTSYITQAR